MRCPYIDRMAVPDIGIAWPYQGFGEQQPRGHPAKSLGEQKWSHVDDSAPCDVREI